MCCNCRFSTSWFCKGPAAYKTVYFLACTAKNNLLIGAIIAFHFQKSAVWFGHLCSLLEIEFLCTEAGSLMCLVALAATVSQGNPFCWFVTTWDLGELPTVSYTSMPFLLPSDTCGH